MEVCRCNRFDAEAGSPARACHPIEASLVTRVCYADYEGEGAAILRMWMHRHSLYRQLHILNHTLFQHCDRAIVTVIRFMVLYSYGMFFFRPAGRKKNIP